MREFGKQIVRVKRRILIQLDRAIGSPSNLGYGISELAFSEKVISGVMKKRPVIPVDQPMNSPAPRVLNIDDDNFLRDAQQIAQCKSKFNRRLQMVKCILAQCDIKRLRLIGQEDQIMVRKYDLEPSFER